MLCEKCRVCLSRVPGEEFSYSDHMGVVASFQIRKNITGKAILTLKYFGDQIKPRCIGD